MIHRVLACVLASLPLMACQFENFVLVTEDDTYRYVVSNGIPDHETGTFPNANNPNFILPQDQSFRMLLAPVDSGGSVPAPLFGVALNGVVFDPGTAEFWNGDRDWNYEALTGSLNLGTDASNAHVQPDGTYHYHGIPEGLVDRLIGDVEAMLLVGYASDGFPVYARWGHEDALDAGSALVELAASYRVKTGTRGSGPGGAYDGTYTADWEYVAGQGDLDECNGRFGVTPEHPQGTFHYVLTDAFPFIPRCVVADPDSSFERLPPPAA